MPRITLIAPDGSRTSATEEGALLLIEQGYEEPAAEPKSKRKPSEPPKTEGE